MFITYYSNKIPSKKTIIQNYLRCFGELLKLSEGKHLKELRRKFIEEHLKSLINEEFVKEFIDYALIEPKYKEFDDNCEKFSGIEFLEEYHDFLKKAGYQFLGKVTTGAFLIWRALIKYLESVQKEKEFQDKKKAALLENWSYFKAIEHGLQAEKIILRNPKRKPTNIYKKMLKQTKDFPRRLQLNAEFFGEHKKSSFEEIDLAIKVNEYLITIECKGTSAPIQEIGKYSEWIDNLYKNYRHFNQKLDILEYNIQNQIITHPFLREIKHYYVFQIQTEGIFPRHYVMTPKGYLGFLDELEKNIKNNTIKQFFGNSSKKI